MVLVLPIGLRCSAPLHILSQMTILSLLDDKGFLTSAVDQYLPSARKYINNLATTGVDTLVKAAPLPVRIAYPYLKNSMARYMRSFRSGSRRLSYRGARKYRRRSTPNTRATYRMPIPRSVIKQDHAAVITQSLDQIRQHNIIMPARGSTQDDRVSNVIKVLDWRVSILFDKVNNQSPGDVRIIVFKWLQGYTSAVASSVLLETGTNLAAFLSPYFQQDARNYKIMLDQTIRFNGVTNASTNLVVGQNQLTWRRNFRLNQLVTFNADTADAGDVDYVLLVIPSQVAPVNLGNMVIKQSSRFVDV